MYSCTIQETHHGEIINKVDGHPVIDCQHCGFKHIWPYPSEKSISELYRKSYYTDVYPFSGNISENEIENANQQFSERLLTIEAKLPRGKRKLLDIGAGNCGFLYTARERGWDVLGIEPSEQGQERARLLQLPFICDAFSRESMQGYGPFDLIHLNCVLEHILDPIELLRTSYELLAPGGYISICVPNDFNPLQAAFIETQQKSPWWIVPLQHINYFDTKSLPKLLERIGFEIEHSETTFPIELFLLFGDDYISKPEQGRASYHRITQFEENMKKSGQSGLVKEIYKAFEKLNIGRRIIVTAKK